MAPLTRMPSSPRLMRPLRSVMHSPRLTNRNGVLTRMAPPSTATGTPHQPSDVTSGAHQPERRPPAVQRLARQDQHERHALEHEYGGVGQIETALQHAAAGRDPADQHRDGHDGDRVLADDAR